MGRMSGSMACQPQKQLFSSSPGTGETELPDSSAAAEITGTDEPELIGGEVVISRTDRGSFDITLMPGKWSLFRFYDR